MELIDRIALIVRPKRRFAQWVNALDEERDQPLFDLENERNNPSIYMVASGPELPELSELVDAYAIDIFEAELEGWSTDEARWPANRTPHVFRDWFDVTLSDLAWDLDEAEPFYAADDELSDGMPMICAWCGTELDEDAPVTTVSLKGLRDAPRAEPSIIELSVGGRSVPAVMPKDDSEGAREGVLAFVMFCGDRCAEEFNEAWKKERGALNS